MEVNYSQENDILCCDVAGRLESSTASSFEQDVNEKAASNTGPLLIDMSNLAYISSAGLRAILLLTKAAQSKGVKLVLCSLPPQIEEVFKISGFDRIITIHPSRKDAISALT